MLLFFICPYRAEKKFKNIINDEEVEHIGTINDNGESQCYLCGEEFASKENAIKHLEKDHDIKKEKQDFEASSSDEFENEDGNEESSETEGSSGVDEKDERSDDGVGDSDDNDSNINLIGRQCNVEPQESKNARNLVQGYVESLRQDHKLSSKVIGLTENL